MDAILARWRLRKEVCNLRLVGATCQAVRRTRPDVTGRLPRLSCSLTLRTDLHLVEKAVLSEGFLKFCFNLKL